MSKTAQSPTVISPEPPLMEESAPHGTQAKALNPYAGERQVVVTGTSSSAEVNRAVAEVQATIMLAKQFPRDRQKAAEIILNECCRETLAEAAIYSYTKGGTEITGPSIRLAEVLAQNWGNFQFGWDELNRSNGASEVIAFAWDCETNVRRTMKFFIKHWRDTKKGGYAIKDERDIYELCANQAARRMRACILNIIPGDIVEAAVKQCELTLVVNEKVTPEKIKSLVAAFEGFGVSKSQIEKRCLCKIEALNGARMMQLRKIYTGLRDGMSKAEEFFEPEIPTASEGTPINVSADGTVYKTETGEISDWDAIVDELILGLQGSSDIKSFDVFIEESADQLKKLSESKDTTAVKKWTTAFNKRRAELSGGKLV